ncbi:MULTISPECIES: sugar phosphate isomerase/epimerase [unclassified Curtobacterium]|uniref:sugar phosphate isomerase/epimerase family protein n=1 Tax=unclassified Curtobacterium TaxID=257496 RepID=UPI000D83FC8E|nr:MULTISPECIES: sugar phosphate isomerase/epimerase [unclassified Curtobacterium]PYY38811.1 sugar phosphate isomerase/epimerase [Curtobacterium sp. MCPF17_046]PYY46633.1 sugar phosphate isomerase/epimerase [Curtobacterium sp. MCBD17_023]WIB14873.1 sugar phosphate isomerase/epimerase [Curtobacterium sp. MCPF17_050]
MKLGMLTACLPGWDLAHIAEFASAEGYERLEVAVWPGTGGRDFEAAHLPVATFTDEDARATRELLDRTGLEISALAYYENNLHQDPARREEVRTHLRHAVDAAQLLGVPYVGTFVGRDMTKSVRENMAEGDRVLPELVDYAGERGVRLVIENCVMEGWHPDGYPGNIAYSPELWEWVTGLGFGLNWDPSHLTWIGIDPVETILPFAEHIVHAQAKDVELFPGRRNEYGFFGKVDKGEDPWEMGWWRFRVPGRGVVDWPRVVDRLYEAGFDGTLSVEHEDPLWGGEDVKVLEGLRIAHRTLRPLIAAE